jgi:hypothetical protein
VIVLVLVGVATIVLLASGFGERPAEPILRPSLPAQAAIDDNVGNVLRSAIYLNEVVIPSHTAEEYRSNLVNFVQSDGVHRMNESLAHPIRPDAALNLLDPRTMLQHTSRNEYDIGGTCVTCLRQPWANREGLYAPIDAHLQSTIDHLRSLI